MGRKLRSRLKRSTLPAFLPALALVLILVLTLFLLSGCTTAAEFLRATLSGDFEEEDEYSVSISLKPLFKSWASPEKPAYREYPSRFAPPPDYLTRFQRDGWDIRRLDTARNTPGLSRRERLILLTINMVRRKPARFAELYIRPLVDASTAQARNYSGMLPMDNQEKGNPVTDLYRQLRQQPPAPLLSPHAGLIQSAADHAGYLRRRQSLTRTGPTGSLPEQRMDRYGRWQGIAEELLSAGFISGPVTVFEWLISPGDPFRRDRRILLDKRYRFIGLASRPHPVLRTVTVADLTADYEGNKAD